MNNVRSIAVDMLEEIEKGGAYSTILFHKKVEHYSLNVLDKSLLTELVYGTLQRKLTIDYYLSYVIKTKKVQSWVRQLLRISVFQFLYLDRVPNHAILNEAVKIAKKRGHQGIGNFVNGVLRNFSRMELPDLTQLTPLTKRFSVQYSMPEWIVEKFIAQYGENTTEQLLQSLLLPPKMSARIQNRSISRDEVIERLEKEGFVVSKSPLTKEGIILEKGSVMNSELFKDGVITIQDESSMLVAPLGKLSPDSQVLDTCSAPGGKTTHMASFLSEKEQGKVIALDLHAHKIKLVQQNAKRLQVDAVIETQVMDAREAKNVYAPSSFDAVFVDAPCSGLGLMRRKPDIKYTKMQDSLLQLHYIQCEILDAVASLVKKGGRLVYSTCTLAQEENEKTVAYFLEKHPEFEIEPISEYNEVKASVTKQGSLAILPHEYQTDGFYICRFKRI